MATTKIPKYQTLSHLYVAYSSSTDTSASGTPVTLRTGTINKARSDTALQVLFMGWGYSDTQSGSLNLYIDGVEAANATTTSHSIAPIIGGGFAGGISAGSHSWEFKATSQSTSNTFTIPAWSMCALIVTEV